MGAPYAWERVDAPACAESVPVGGAFMTYAVNAPEVAWSKGLWEDGNRAAHASPCHRASEYGEEYFTVVVVRLRPQYKSVEVRLHCQRMEVR